MGKLSIVQKIRFKKLTTFLAVVLVLLLAFSFVTNFFGTPNSVKAGITQDVDATTIGGGTYLIDSNGSIKQPPAKLFYNANGSLLDYRYYSYLFEDTGYSVNNQTNLILNHTYVIMEGTQSLKSLTVQNDAKITQPYPDRSGNINAKPLYSINFWAMRLTGFIKIPADTTYYLYTVDTQLNVEADDGASFEVSGSDTINNSTAWTYSYSNRSPEYAAYAYTSTTWPTKNITANSFLNDAPTRTILTNSDPVNDKYVPVRITQANLTENANFLGEINEYDGGGNLTDRRYMRISDFYGAGLDNKVDTSAQYKMDFEYYISQKDEGPVRDLSNAIMTAWKKDLNVDTNFSYPYGLGAAGSDLMRFKWSDVSVNDYRSSPLCYYLHNAQLPSTYPWREVARYDPFPVNAYISSYMTSVGALNTIPGGLTLNVSENININSGSIDLMGTGYPGATADFYSAEGTSTRLNMLTPTTSGPNTNPPQQPVDAYNILGRVRGGSINADGSPGGGYSNSVYLNGAAGNGGSHAGRGGYLIHENVGRIEARADAYGDQYNPNTMGSGGGSGNDNGVNNIAGSGGGLIKIISNSLTIDYGSIDVSGSAGKWVGWHTNTGGAGGAVNIVTNTLSLNSGSLISADGSDGWPSNMSGDDLLGQQHIGGGGGYIYMEYNTDNSQSDVRSFLSVKGGDGGDGDNYDIETPNIDGEPGIIELSFCRKASAGLNKRLNPVPGLTYRDGFNPYALQIGDTIEVEIDAGSLTQGVPATITDEALNVPGKLYKCAPIDGTDVPNADLLDDNGVTWSFTPDSENQKLHYNCKVK